MPELPDIALYLSALAPRPGARTKELGALDFERGALPVTEAGTRKRASLAGQPCPVCGAPVQRIAYAQSEANHCARCQTEGKLLADRALSRLLHEDWPLTLEQLEEIRPLAFAVTKVHG